MKVVTLDANSGMSVLRRCPYESPSEGSFIDRDTEYVCESAIEPGFLYGMKSEDGKKVYLWNCYDDVWICVDPERQVANGTRLHTLREPQISEHVAGYYSRKSGSFVYYLYKNACSCVSYIYSGREHSIYNTEDCKVIQISDLVTLDLSHVRKWAVWRPTAARIASVASMITRSCKVAEFFCPFRILGDLQKSKRKAISFCVGVGRVMLRLGEHHGLIDGLSCNHHLVPQSIGYVIKGLRVAGVDDIVPNDRINKFVTNELGMNYMFKSSNGTNGGQIDTGDVENVVGFDELYKLDSRTLARLSSTGSRIYE